MSRKRASSTRLASRPSPHHPSVTLFEASSVAEVASNASVRQSKRVKLEPDTNFDIEDTILSVKAKETKLEFGSIEVAETVKDEKPKATSSRQPSTSPKKAKPIRTALDAPHPAPPRWRETYDALKSMREKMVAPVDSMGCAQAPLKELDPKVRSVSIVQLV